MGMHGSNMLLPSAHAGASVVLMPEQKWRNLAQDTLIPELDPRANAVRNIYIPSSTKAETVAEISAALLERLPNLILGFVQGARPSPELYSNRDFLREKTADISQWTKNRFPH
jgi:hypothetical protein